MNKRKRIGIQISQKNIKRTKRDIIVAHILPELHDGSADRHGLKDVESLLVTSHHLRDMIKEYYLTIRFKDMIIRGPSLYEWQMLLRYPDRASVTKHLLMSDIQPMAGADHAKIIEDCLPLFSNLKTLELFQRIHSHIQGRTYGSSDKPTQNSFLQSPVCRHLTSIEVDHLLPSHTIVTMKDLEKIDIRDYDKKLKSEPELLRGAWPKLRELRLITKKSRQVLDMSEFAKYHNEIGTLTLGSAQRRVIGNGFASVKYLTLKNEDVTPFLEPLPDGTYRPIARIRLCSQDMNEMDIKQLKVLRTLTEVRITSDNIPEALSHKFHDSHLRQLSSLRVLTFSTFDIHNRGVFRLRSIYHWIQSLESHASLTDVRFDFRYRSARTQLEFDLTRATWRMKRYTHSGVQGSLRDDEDEALRMMREYLSNGM